MSYLKELEFATTDGVTRHLYFSKDVTLLTGDDMECLTVLSALERLFANDGSAYYDGEDKRNTSTVYAGKFVKGKLEFNGMAATLAGKYSEIQLDSGTGVSVRERVPKNIRVLRGLGSYVRNFVCYPMDREQVNRSAGKSRSFTHYDVNDVSGDNIWYAIQITYNRIVGANIMQVDTVGKKLEFDWSKDVTGLGERKLKNLYLLVSEIFGTMPTVILADIRYLQGYEEVQDRLIQSIMDIIPNSYVKCAVFVSDGQTEKAVDVITLDLP